VRFAIVAHRQSETNLALASACADTVAASILKPRKALLSLERGDVALGRLDVRDTLDGIEEGVQEFERLGLAGVTVLNPPRALVAAHDKLATTHVLRLAGLPHPQTVPLSPTGSPAGALAFPLVLKPRFGSWGRDVTLCADAETLERALQQFAFRPWLRSGGAIVQELVPARGYDLRLIVAAGRVVGAAKRIAASHEWRTNVALGGTSVPVKPPQQACELAEAAAAAAGADLLGVDLVPTEGDDLTIIELNGAVDFKSKYSLRGNVFREAVSLLLRSAAGFAPRPAGVTVRPGLATEPRRAFE
jgi:RimK family alpha-L-glutamate ligase